MAKVKGTASGKGRRQEGAIIEGLEEETQPGGWARQKDDVAG